MVAARACPRRGISIGGLHYVLNALVERGLIKLGNFSLSQDKRRYAYVLAPKSIAEKAATTRRFLARKVAEYDALRAKIDTLRDELGLKGSDKPSHHG